MITIDVLELTSQLQDVNSFAARGDAELFVGRVLGECSFARVFSNLPIKSVESGDHFRLYSTGGGEVVQSEVTIEGADIIVSDEKVTISRDTGGVISIYCGSLLGVTFTERQAEELLVAMRNFVRDDNVN